MTDFEPKLIRNHKVIRFGFWAALLGLLLFSPVIFFGLDGNEVCVLLFFLFLLFGLIPNVYAELNFRKLVELKLKFVGNKVFIRGREISYKEFDELFFSKKVERNADGTSDQEFLLDLEFYEEKEEVLNRINAYLLSQNESNEPQGVQHEHSR